MDELWKECEAKGWRDLPKVADLIRLLKQRAVEAQKLYDREYEKLLCGPPCQDLTPHRYGEYGTPPTT